MREILFRGKRKDNGEWICGDLLQDVESGICAIVSYVNLGGNIHDLSESCIFAVIPETVGQYTGLTDKNGTKIFEGDIVRAITRLTDIYVEAVTFKNGAFWYKNWSWVKFGFKFEKTEVIGNIHDNPELLNAAANGRRQER